MTTPTAPTPPPADLRADADRLAALDRAANYPGTTGR